MENKLKIIGTKVINNKEIREVEGGFGEGQKCILASDVAKQHELRLDKINALINNNIKRFNNNDIIDFLNPSEGLREFAIENGLFTSNRTKNIFLLSERGYAKLSNLMKGQSKVSEIILKEYFNSDIIPEPTNNKEYDFYEKLHEQLEVFNILDGECQYSCCNNKYRIDYYIPSLNIAIEYDENGHKNYTYDKHEGRQKDIEQELGCKFIRVTDEYSINKAIAIVIKNIFDL